MSVTNQTNKVSGAGNGSTVTFSYPFKIFTVSQLYAYDINDATGVVTGPLTYTTDYTATISAVSDGGTITFVVAPAVGHTWFVKRIVPLTQSASIPSEGVFPGVQFSNQLDLMTMMIIQANEAVSRAIQMPFTFSGTVPVLPTPLNDYVIGWDGTTGTMKNILPGATGPQGPQGDTGATGPAGPTVTSANADIAVAAGVLTLNSGTGANQVVKLTAASKLPAVDGSLLTNIAATALSYVKCSEVQSSGTAGGGSTSGSWITRVLNTKDNDTGSIATLATNQVTLPAGTYMVRAIAPFYNSINTQIRLQNITDSTTAVIGLSWYNTSSTSNGFSTLMGLFTIASAKAFALQYQCSNSEAGDGLGRANSFGSEVYSMIEFLKLA